MFDISFVELLVIAVIGLLVIGPERLPETVRTVTMWIGRFKRSLRETRREIEQHLGADEIRQQLHNEEIMRNLEKMRSEMDALKQDVRLESELYENTDDAAADDQPQESAASKPEDEDASDPNSSEPKQS